MKLNSESILTLDANKTYYIANSTGEIKEAGLWQRFKCWLGVGDGREKVQRLAEQVKAALLADGGVESENTLNDEIGRLNLTSSLSGAALKEIASRFRADHADSVARADAGRLVEAKVKDFVRGHSDPAARSDSFRIHPDPQNIEYMTRLATMVAKKAADNVDANTDKEALGANITHRLNSFLCIVDVAINTRNPCWENRRDYVLPDGTQGRSNLPLPVLNELSFRVFASCLFRQNGEMLTGGYAGMQLMRFPADLLTGNVKDAILNSKEVPMDLVKTCNDALISSFNGPSRDFSKLYKGVLAELQGEMAARYGTAVRKDASVYSFGTGLRMRELLSGVVQRATEEGRLVKAGEIKDALRDEFCRGAAKMVTGDFADKLAAAHKLPKPDGTVAFNLLKRHPEAIEDIMAAKTPDEATAAAKRHEGKILSLIEASNTVNATVAGLRDRAIDRIASETGIDRADLVARLTTSRLEDKAKSLGIEILTGRHPGSREKGFSIESAFNKVLDDFVKVRVTLLNEIKNEKGLNEAGKAAFIRVALLSEKPDAHHPGPIANIVDSGAVSVKDFKDALKADNDASIAEGLIKIGAKVNAKMLEIYGDKWEDLGPDERDIGYELLMNKIVSEDGELVELLQAKRDKIVPWVENEDTQIKGDAMVKKLMSIVYSSIL